MRQIRMGSRRQKWSWKCSFKLLKKCFGRNINGTTIGGNFIQVKDAQKTVDTGAHEVGHALGLIHSSSGLMTPSSMDVGRLSNLNIGGLKDMVTFPLKGKINSEGGNEAGRGTVRYLNSLNSTDRLYNPLNRRGKIER